MEGDRILRELTSRNLGGLHEDTKNYLDPCNSCTKKKSQKNGVWKCSEETNAAKYELFCYKLIRCGITALKEASDNDKEFKQVAEIIKTAVTALDGMITVDDGKYLPKLAPLDQHSNHLYHIVVHMLNNCFYEDGFLYSCCLLKYLRLMQNQGNRADSKLVKGLNNLMLPISNKLWNGAMRFEQSFGLGRNTENFKTVLKYRVLSIQCLGEANCSLDEVVDRTLKSSMKFQKDCGANTDCDALLNLFKSVSEVVIKKAAAMVSNQCSVTEKCALSMLEFGRLLSITYRKAGKTTEALPLLEQIQRHINNLNIQSSKTCSSLQSVLHCVPSIWKVMFEFSSIAVQTGKKKSSTSASDFKTVERFLGEVSSSVSEVLMDKNLSYSCISIVVDSLETLSKTIVHSSYSVCGKGQNNVLPHRTFTQIVAVFLNCVKLLQQQCGHIQAKSSEETGETQRKQLRQQHQKLLDRQLAVFTFLALQYQVQLQATSGSCRKDTDLKKRCQLAKECLSVLQKAKQTIQESVASNPHAISRDEYKWFGTAVYNLGYLLHKNSMHSEGAELLSLACDKLHYWCFTAAGVRVQDFGGNCRKVQLCAKYSILAECQKCTKCYQDALDTVSKALLVNLKISDLSDSTNQVKEQIHQWVSYKSFAIKYSEEDEDDLRKRTLKTVLVGLEGGTELSETQLTFVLEEELASYKAQKQKTSLDQVSVAEQLIDLYRSLGNLTYLGTAMLEKALAEHDVNCDDDSWSGLPLESCQQAVTILEQEYTDAIDDYCKEDRQALIVQDRLSCAYMWLCIFQHEVAMNIVPSSGEKSSGSNETTAQQSDSSVGDTSTAEEDMPIDLDQPYVRSLHAAIEGWTSVINLCLSTEGKVDLSVFHNPENTSQQLQIAASMCNILHQPLNEVHALHLSAVISQSIGSQPALDRAVSAYSQAVETLCSISDFHHADLVMKYCSDIVERSKPAPSAKIQYLLGKSAYLLLTGKLSEGEKCLKEAMSNDLLKAKTRTSYMLQARIKCLCAEYLFLPPIIYQSTLEDDILGPQIATECVMAGQTLWIQIAELMDIISKENLDPDITVAVSSNLDKSMGHLCVFQNLMKASEQAGAICLHQGAVREAKRFMSIGLDISRRLVSPCRATSFLEQLSLLEMHRGVLDKAEAYLKQTKNILQPVLTLEDSDVASLPGTPFLHHSKGCTCSCCCDPVMHGLQCALFVAIAKYLEMSSRKEECEKALKSVVELCQNASQRTALSLDELSIILRLGICAKNAACKGELSERDENVTTRRRGKGRNKVVKEAKRKQDSVEVPSLEETAELMSCVFTTTSHMAMADLLLQKGDAQGANKALRTAKEALRKAEDAHNGLTRSLIPVAAKLCLMLSKVSFVMDPNSREAVASRWKISWDVHMSNVPDEHVAVKNGKPETKGSIQSKDSKRTRATRNAAAIKANTISKDSLEEMSNEVCISKVSTEDHPEQDTKDSDRRHIKSAVATKSRKKNARAKSAITTQSESSAAPQTLGRKAKGTKGTVCNSDQLASDVKGKSTTKGRGRGKTKKVDGVTFDVADSIEDTTVALEGSWEHKVNCVVEGSGALERIIRHLKKGYDLCQGLPNPNLFSSICNALAVCYGRAAPKEAAFYLNAASAVALRQQAIYSSGRKLRKIEKDLLSSGAKDTVGKDVSMVELATKFDSLTIDSETGDSPQGIPCDVRVQCKALKSIRKTMMSTTQSYQRFPKEWTVCTLTLTSATNADKELVISRVTPGSDPVILKIPVTLNEQQEDNIQEVVVMDLSKLLQGGIMEEFAEIQKSNNDSMSLDDTSEFWTQRARLDKRMKRFTQRLEDVWLGQWKGVVLGQPVCEDRETAVKNLTSQLLELVVSITGETPDIPLLQILVDSFPYLSKPQTQDALSELTGLDSNSPLFKKVHKEFLQVINKSPYNISDAKSKESKSQSARHPVILILSQDIQHLPWENMPVLRDHCVTRMPSLQFVQSHDAAVTELDEQSRPSVDISRTYYVLDPANNLPSTQKTFQKWFESVSGWKGVVGKPPSSSEFTKALTDHDMFVYCGHGTGQKFLRGDEVKRLHCRAVTLLMGCSSGRLMVHGECEPEGMVLNYLLAGCPAIVANLWDVTDKDIDRFAAALLRAWLQAGDSSSLLHFINQSREACKLQFLIGAAPVVYGLPLQIQSSK